MEDFYFQSVSISSVGLFIDSEYLTDSLADSNFRTTAALCDEDCLLQSQILICIEISAIHVLFNFEGKTLIKRIFLKKFL